ncbi:hypothetical protein NL676_002341 [Syzygium grande]|nr:hypothetical protein NL676_002341 [Syzygium grande]
MRTRDQPGKERNARSHAIYLAGAGHGDDASARLLMRIREGEESGNHSRGPGAKGLSFGRVGFSSGFLVGEDEQWKTKEGERLVRGTHPLHASIAEWSGHGDMEWPAYAISPRVNK